jgi:hypothetical protein
VSFILAVLALQLVVADDPEPQNPTVIFPSAITQN